MTIKEIEQAVEQQKEIRKNALAIRNEQAKIAGAADRELRKLERDLVEAYRVNQPKK